MMSMTDPSLTLGAQAWSSVVDGIRAAVDDPMRGWETIAIVVGVPLLAAVFVWAHVRLAAWLVRMSQQRTHKHS